MIAGIVRTAYVKEIECNFRSMVIDITGKFVVVQTVVANLYVCSFLYELHVYDA